MSSYTMDDLSNAVQQVRAKHISYRKVSAQYGVPRSTLYDHVTEKVSCSKRGTPTVLTEAEEQELCDWALHMAEIGYGRTCAIVMLDKDGRENPFTDNCPGRDWRYAFLKCHPTLAMQLPESLQSARASSCTPERLDKWYKDFTDFMQKNGLQKQPQRIWNADESGFPLCPKTSRVLTLRNKKHMYSGAYFGKSDNGWMVTEVLYGWVANHFVTHIPPVLPVVLLVDGHTTHIDVEVSKICKQNGVLLYCLLPHSSHITQPLDVGFFGALKTSWAKAVDKFKIAHMGSSVTKETFA